MFRKLLPLIMFDVVLSLVFVFSSVNLWGTVNDSVQSFTLNYVAITQVSVNPLQIIISHMYLSNGNLNLGTLPIVIPNFPFILFWVALAGNLYFVVRLLKTAEKIV